MLQKEKCLRNHTQYICGSCGRCICIEKDEHRGLQRWNFPFQSLAIAKCYLRVADVMNKNTCGIYEIESDSGRISYKIFVDDEELVSFLKKHKNKRCRLMKAIYQEKEYREYPNTQIRKLTSNEIEEYLKQAAS